jgi:hypothetical protein
MRRPTPPNYAANLLSSILEGLQLAEQRAVRPSSPSCTACAACHRQQPAVILL